MVHGNARGEAALHQRHGTKEEDLQSWNAGAINVACTDFALGATDWNNAYAPAGISGKTPPLSLSLINKGCG